MNVKIKLLFCQIIIKTLSYIIVARILYEFFLKKLLFHLHKQIWKIFSI